MLAVFSGEVVEVPADLVAAGGRQPDAVAQDEGVRAGEPLPRELGAGRVHPARRPRAPRLLPHQPGPPPPKVLIMPSTSL